MAPKKRKLAVRARTQRVIERDILTSTAPAFVRDKTAEEKVCGACLLHIEPESKIGAIDNCTHVFHHECAEKWSQTENSCPQCKVRFFWLAAYADNQRESLTKIESKDQEEQEDEEFEDISLCEKCKEVGDEAQLLLCDGMHGTCNATFHFRCVGLSTVPRGSWFCPDCLERGFDVDARGRRGRRAPEATTSPCEAPQGQAGRAEPAADRNAEASTPPPRPAPEGRATPAVQHVSRRLPSQLQLSALACLTPAVEVPAFQAPAAREQPAGLFATFAARRRREAAQEPTFISLNPSYEEDFMAKQKAKGE
ncbi:unnamed protein product [Effrenium voratum]|uniref:PHD and RING finger domain-containing protein 1 n=1 Tax=Effrenium voratum TaxID=2562239 RepID=A0AA36JBY1_9DINO|nr:unnamed protein product [Effrenium voratum]CAJ1459253.1 unnamed protein product [Effrenium voratum]